MPDWRRGLDERFQRLRKIQALDFAGALITQFLPDCETMSERMSAIGHREQLRKIARELEAEAPSRQGSAEGEE